MITRETEIAIISQIEIVIELSYTMLYIPTSERILKLPTGRAVRAHQNPREEETMIPKSNQQRCARVAVMVLAALTIAASVQAQDPVEVSVEVTGTAVPGATVQATANVTVNDGSTIQSYSWTQVGGADVGLSGTSSQTVTVTLPGQGAYKDYLIHVLMEPPITEEQLPPNVPVPEGEFPGGLQDRFQVVGVNPFTLEHTAATVLEVEVTTSSGTYHGEGHINTAVPWKVATGLLNVPIGAPVLLHGKDQDSYDWTLSPPSGSGTMLSDAATQNPEFVPDVTGHYSVMVTDAATDELVTLAVYAGTWLGVIVDQDENGRPIADPSCTGCHNDNVAYDGFTPWAQTGHAEIFTNNINTSPYWGTQCFACHTVGYDLEVANDGIDDASDYHAFLDSGLIGSQSWRCSRRPRARPISSVRTATARRSAVPTCPTIPRGHRE
jgi:hypothetical protein